MLFFLTFLVIKEKNMKQRNSFNTHNKSAY